MACKHGAQAGSTGLWPPIQGRSPIPLLRSQRTCDLACIAAKPHVPACSVPGAAGMSNSFTAVDLMRLPFPSTMKIDYVRCSRRGGGLPARLATGSAPRV